MYYILCFVTATKPEAVKNNSPLIWKTAFFCYRRPVNAQVSLHLYMIYKISKQNVNYWESFRSKARYGHHTCTYSCPYYSYFDMFDIDARKDTFLLKDVLSTILYHFSRVTTDHKVTDFRLIFVNQSQSLQR